MKNKIDLTGIDDMFGFGSNKSEDNKKEMPVIEDKVSDKKNKDNKQNIRKTETNKKTDNKVKVNKETDDKTAKNQEIDKDYQVLDKQDDKPENPDQPNDPVIEQLDSSFTVLEEEKQNKFRDLHTLKGCWLENGLVQQIDQICKGKGKGFQTKLINQALKFALQHYKG